MIQAQNQSLRLEIEDLILKNYRTKEAARYWMREYIAEREYSFKLLHVMKNLLANKSIDSLSDNEPEDQYQDQKVVCCLRLISLFLDSFE